MITEENIRNAFESSFHGILDHVSIRYYKSDDQVNTSIASIKYNFHNFLYYIFHRGHKVVMDSFLLKIELYRIM
jgi:hypothetical protein